MEQLFLQRIGGHFVEVTEDRVELQTPITPEMLQPIGVLHGGMSAYLAESAASRGSFEGVDIEKYDVLGLDLTSTHLLPVYEGDVAITVATAMHRGGRVQVWKIEQFRKSDGAKFNISQLTTYSRKKHPVT